MAKLLEGEFRPEGVHREWCDPDVLQQVRRKTLARLRREVVPAEQHTFVRLLTRWQGVAVPRRGLDALLDTIEILQGAALIASDLEREILPARVIDYSPDDLDALMASGNVVWIGREPTRRPRWPDRTLPGRCPAETAHRYNAARALRTCAADRGCPSRNGRVVLRASPSGRGRRLPRRYADRPMGTGVGGPRHQRHAASPAQSAVRQGGRAQSPRTARRTARLARIPAPLPRPHRRQPRRRRPLVAGRAASRPTHHTHRVERQHRAATARAQRHRDARNRARREHPRRLPRALPRAQNDGGERLDPPRHVRRRTGRRPIRA